MNFRQFKQLLKYADQNAEAISQMPEVNLSKSYLFRDILKSYFKYHLLSIQYKNEKFWQLSPEQRDEVAKKYELKNKYNKAWARDFYENHRFLIKWSAYKYEASAKLQKKRINAYRNRYNIGEKCYIGPDVVIDRHHFLEGSLKIGNHVGLSRHVRIDYSGELVIHDNVYLADGVIIETHTHIKDKAEPGRLEICDGVSILSRAYISDSCHVIGRGARIGAGTFVRNNVPPYAIMMGNPGKIIGFRMSPEEIVEFEERKYSVEERLPRETLQRNYEKYFLNRWKEIREFTKI